MNVQLRKQKPEPAQTPGLTGVPVQRRLAPERCGGQSFDDVRVRYNSQPEREAGLAPEQYMPAPALWGVIQMALPVIPRQSGCNCGYHALARALIQLDSTPCGDPVDLERRLASFAIANGYSVIGEAFDPYVLTHVGNLFCRESGISAQCVCREFNNEGELSDILKDSQTSGSVILFPYFPDKGRRETYLGPGVNPDNKDNAHWGALEPEEDGSAMLYEGNFRGSSPSGTSVIGGKGQLPPLPVTPEGLLNSNQSIQPEFNWDKFFSDGGLDWINEQKQKVIVNSEAPNSGRFANEAAFKLRVRQVMERIAALLRERGRTAAPIPHIEGAPLIQPVSLKGALVEVKK